MLKFTTMLSRIAASLKAPVRAPAAVQPHAGRALACQSLCLQCDARTPCALGRLVDPGRQR